MSGCLPRVEFLIACLVAVTAAPAAAAPIVLAVANPTINLTGDYELGSQMSIAYHAGNGQYYGGGGGNTGTLQYVWDATGDRLFTGSANFDLRAYNYNSNTGALEGISFNACCAPGMFEMGLDGSGFFTGSNTQLLGSLPGLPGQQTMPAYDAARDLLYARSSTGTINVVSHATGTLASTITLDLAAAGNPTLQSQTLGYDSVFDVFVVLDVLNMRAVTFDYSGAFLGYSLLPGLAALQPIYNAGYANGQLFVFDSQSGFYRGYDLFTVAQAPEAASSVLLVVGLGLFASARRRRQQHVG